MTGEFRHIVEGNTAMSIFDRVENMVDPFEGFNTATPSKNIMAYVRSQIGPYRNVITLILIVGFVSAMADTFLIYYAGRLIDIINSTGREAIWSRHGVELLLAGTVIVLLKPIATSLNYLLMFNGFSTNMMSQARWRAHKHMLGQSMSFFQNDFAGRLSNRVLNMGMAVEDSIFLVLEGFWTTIVFLIGMLIVLAQIDVRLVLPLLVWIACFVWYAIWLAPRIGKASKKLSNANSRVTARVVDAYTNIETVKLFSHAEREEKFALTAMKRHRLRFAKIMRMFATMIAGVQMVLTGPATKRWGERTVIKATLLGLTVTFLLILTAYDFTTLLITVGLFALTNAMLRPSISSLVSKETEVDQGLALGLNSSFMSLGRFTGPLLAGFLFDIRITLPYLVGSLIMFLGFLFVQIKLKEPVEKGATAQEA